MSRLAHVLGAQRRKVQARDVTTWADKKRIVIEGTHPKQRAFALDPGRRVAALVARGGGKTTGSKARLLLRMLSTPNARCLYIATTRGHAEELMWAPLKDTVEQLGIEAKWDETKLKLKFLRNGAQLRLVGADNKREIEKLRGLPHHEVIIDEAASHDIELLQALMFRIIGPRLGDYNGVLCLIGTPGHILRGPFYDATRTGSEIGRAWEDRDKPEFRDWLGWSLHKWTLQDGAPYVPEMDKLWAEALVEKQTNGWSDDNPIWRREYLGIWAADDTENVYRYRPHLDDGMLWNQWDPEIDKETGLAVLPKGHEWRFVYGMDMGHGDPFALEIFAHSLTDKTLWHVFEFEKKGMYARTIAQVLIGDDLQHDPPGGLIGATGWPDGMDADKAGLGDMVLNELANVYGIAIEPAEKKNKHDAIELFNGDLIDGRIKIIKGSKLEAQLQELQWDVDRYGKLKEDKSQRNDCTDAAIYARRRAHHLFSEAPTQPKYVPGSQEALEAEAIQRHAENDDDIEEIDDFDDDDDWY